MFIYLHTLTAQAFIDKFNPLMTSTIAKNVTLKAIGNIIMTVFATEMPYLVCSHLIFQVVSD